jgi:hypothetical protein
MFYSFLMIAAVKSEVVAEPKDGVVNERGQTFW